MSGESATVTIHMVSSLDGFIARKDGNISWMHSKDHFEKGKVLSDEDVTAFLEKIDCYVMGANTYGHALELGWPYGDTPVTVLTNRSLSSDKSTVQFRSGDLNNLVDQLKSNYKNIWMIGGAQLTKAFIEQRLADEIVISIMPVILGEGIPFFDNICQQQDLHLNDATAYQDGMVELSYGLV